MGLMVPAFAALCAALAHPPASRCVCFGHRRQKRDQKTQHKVGLLPGDGQESALKDLKTRRAAVRQLFRKSIRPARKKDAPCMKRTR